MTYTGMSYEAETTIELGDTEGWFINIFRQRRVFILPTDRQIPSTTQQRSRCYF